MDFIAGLDTWLFRVVNGRLTSPFLDSLMPYVTDKSNFLGVVIVAAVLILVFGRRQDRVGLLILVAVVATSDLTCNAFKHLLMRPRPCHALEGVRLLVGCGGSYSMPSGHATNIFAAMVFLSLRYSKGLPLFLALAFLVAYSRMYVGVHYPSDVMVGAALGTGIAVLYSVAEKRLPAVYRDYRDKRAAS
jgi:undecaprenyl-diphosphatase